MTISLMVLAAPHIIARGRNAFLDDTEASTVA